MNLHNQILSLSLALTIFSGTALLGLTPSVRAQTLVNPSAASDEWQPMETMVFQYLLQDFRKSGIPLGKDAKVKVSPLVMSGDWLLATWLIVNKANPNGWAGQLLFKKESQRWVYKGGGNYIQEVNTLVEFGVPNDAAQGLAEGADI